MSTERSLNGTPVSVSQPNPIHQGGVAHESIDDPNEKVAFPMLLHDAVCDPATDDCIHWLPGGNLFIISNKKEFAKKVLPKFPGNGVFTSFTRRLKRWGFERIASGPQIGAYKNANFVRENKELAKNMKYMVKKALGMSTIHKNIAKLQAANEFTSSMALGAATVPALDVSPNQGVVSANVSMCPDLMTGFLPSIAGHQQLSSIAQVQGQALNCLALLPNPNIVAPMMGNSPSLAVQLAMLQSLQIPQQVQQALASASSSQKSFAVHLVRTNPKLAAQLLGSRNVLNHDAQPAVATSNL